MKDKKTELKERDDEGVKHQLAGKGRNTGLKQLACMHAGHGSKMNG